MNDIDDFNEACDYNADAILDAVETWYCGYNTSSDELRRRIDEIVKQVKQGS